MKLFPQTSLLRSVASSLLLLLAIPACGDDDDARSDGSGEDDSDASTSNTNSGDGDGDGDGTSIGEDGDGGGDLVGNEVDAGETTYTTRPDDDVPPVTGDAGQTTLDAGPTCEALEPADSCGDGGTLSIVGEYETSFGGELEIEECALDGNAITAFDNDAGWFVYQSACDAVGAAGLWSRLEWVSAASVADVGTDAGAGSLFICIHVFGAASEAAALEAAPANHDNPTETGCGSQGLSPWILVTPQD